MLNDMFKKQEVLMRHYAERDANFPKWPIDITSKHDQKFVRDILVNCADEIFEATRELKNYKSHRQTEVLEFNREDFIEECVDASKFLIEALIMLGVSADEFVNAYNKKDAKCAKRIADGY